jgi:trimeric autotransporter adhesin
MREKSFSFSKINSHNRSTYQGGEKKVMKKALSGVLAASLALSSFASVAFAAEATAPKTAQEMFDALKAKGIF